MDHDIKASIENEKLSSKRLDEKWDFATPEDKKELKAQQAIAKVENNYNMNPELDSDIINSEANMKSEEVRLAHKLSPLYEGLIQTRDDPTCTSAGCPAQTYVAKEEAKIVQYPVDVPLATDVEDSIASEGAASNQLGTAWNIPAWR